MIAGRLVNLTETKVLAQARTWVNTDHALLFGYVTLPSKRTAPWKDSRPRWVVNAAPLPPLRCATDLAEFATKYTKPRCAEKYRDDEEVRSLAWLAKSQHDAEGWKQVHRLRRQRRRAWYRDRLARIVAGDWDAYRGYKADKKPRGWWGPLLSQQSSRQVAEGVQKHLSKKMWDDAAADWDGELGGIVQACEGDEIEAVTHEEMTAALDGMKTTAALGPDGVGVHLLQRLLEEQPAALAGVVQDCVTGDLPAGWDTSLLALLPKIRQPTQPSELRPIAMSSAVQKFVTRVVMNRCFHLVRRPCRWAASGKGRQVADLVAAVGRLRDMGREWRTGIVLVKLDIQGAFDCVHRPAMASFLVDRLGKSKYRGELCFLLRLLGSNSLEGHAPGGAKVVVQANRGIRQGSPESAELFGLLVQMIVAEVHADARWKKCEGNLADVPLDCGCFQDDLFLWGNDTDVLANNIEVLAGRLREVGLQLAVQKTAVICNAYYKGRRVLKVENNEVEFLQPGSAVRVLGVEFDLDAPAGQQARCLMGRVWAAWAQHSHLLCAEGKLKDKVRLIRVLLQGTWQWVAGAVHWNQQELQALNSLQLRVYRLAFRCRRGAGEGWVEFNQRTMRWLRSWMWQQQVERWSTTVLRLQHQLAGHWGRCREGEHMGMAATMLRWRDMSWWRGEQALGPATGVRHPRRFHADNLERRMAGVFGNSWLLQTHDRQKWREGLGVWLEAYDVPWSRARQLALLC